MADLKGGVADKLAGREAVSKQIATLATASTSEADKLLTLTTSSIELSSDL
jgi:hypothetical protein